MTWLSFVILAGALAYTAVGGARDWRRFTTTDSPDTRLHYYRKWIIDTWVPLGLGALLATWALGKVDLLLKPLPHTGVDLRAALPEDSGATAGFYVGLGIGLAAAVGALTWRLRRLATKVGSSAGGTNALIPTNRPERLLAVHLCIAAGVAEELFFRAAVPALVFTLTDSFPLAFLVGVLSFGLYHYYQGITGVVATALIGFILMRLFVSSGTILAPMALHLVIDLWGLLVFPAALAWLARRRGQHELRPGGEPQPRSDVGL